MGNLEVRGTIVYMPGTWGVALPVPNATVELIDVDLPGKSDDAIYQGTTNQQGSFSGTTSDWQDYVDLPPVWVQDSIFPPRGHWENKRAPDPSDVLFLRARIRETRPDGVKSTELVFPYTGNGGPAPVVPVPWGPWQAPAVSLVEINGEGFSDPAAVLAKLRTLIDDGKHVEIAARNSQVRAVLSEFVGKSAEQILALVAQRINLPAVAQLPVAKLTGAEEVALIFAIGTMIAVGMLSAAAAVIMLAIAFAIVYAVTHDYRHMRVTMKANPKTGEFEPVMEWDR